MVKSYMSIYTRNQRGLEILVIVMKVLLINFPSLGSMSAGENFKFIFRESKINDAILFFDECEAIFESRESGGHQVNLLLTEIERCSGHQSIMNDVIIYLCVRVHACIYVDMMG